MKEYSGAVFFVDILGVGALTQGQITISEKDFLAHRFSFNSGFSEHQFCAKLLLKFRRILTSVTDNLTNVKVAQLSDCAFIWSEDPDLVVNVARDIMWKAVLGGLLCRGGLAYGQIVEPDKINTKLGMFICGGAATLRDPHKLLPHIIHTLSDRPVSSTTELSTAKFALALADNIAYLY